MRPMCNIIMMNYIYYEQIDPYNLSANVFGCNIKEKNSNMSNVLAFLFMQVATKRPDF